MLTTALYSPTELHGLTEPTLLLLQITDLTRSLHSRWPQVRASKSAPRTSPGRHATATKCNPFSNPNKHASRPD